MHKTLKQLFKDLVTVGSPSGFEQSAQELYRNFMKPITDEIITDVNGNVICVKKGNGKRRIMIAGHADEVGMMVNYIDDNGYIYVKSIGGLDVPMLPGLRVSIWHKGTPVRAIIGRKPIHMMRDGGGDNKPVISDLWLDMGAKNKAEAMKKVSIGDPITYVPNYEELNSDLVVTKGTDNKAGVFITAMTAWLLKNKQLPINLYCVSTVCEEISMRGAATSADTVNPDIAVVIDVTFTSDVPEVDKRVYGDVSLGGGPVLAIGGPIHPKLRSLIEEVAKKNKVSLQYETTPSRTGTDADAIHHARGGVATILLSVPNRYMHSPNEIISLKDLEATASLIAAFIMELNDKIDLIP